MDPILAEYLRRFRNAFNYPGVYITQTTSLAPRPLGIDIGHGLSGRLRPLPGAAVTDKTLDGYHHGLLVSGAKDEGYVGCVSIIYWGHITRNPGFAIHSARRFKKNSTKKSDARVYEAKLQTLRNNWGAALGKVATLHMLGRIPFASKVIAFLDPLNAGVFDNRINNFLAENPFGEALLGGLGALPRRKRTISSPKASSSTVQHHYRKWCLRLQQLRDGLNTIPNAKWQCTETSPQPWRAIDVERALFWLAGVDLTGTFEVVSQESGSSGGDAGDSEQYSSDADTGNSSNVDIANRIDVPDMLRRLKEFFDKQPKLPVESSPSRLVSV